MNIAMLLISLFTFVEYNCENLFDCFHDSLKQDTEFTPNGKRAWTQRKYWNKLNNITKAITSCGMDGRDWLLPDMVAMCEIENDSVACDLARRSPLRALGYEYVITNSDDIRGIDVALFWHPGSFKKISHQSIRTKFPSGTRPTRDILYVNGIIITGDTLHVFVVHAPSRYGGKKKTDSQRIAVINRLGHAIDSVKTACKNPHIIIAGDFNDEISSPILSQLYQKDLINISATATGNNGAKGTYKYKGKWESIDHIIINNSMQPLVSTCFINDMPFLLEDDVKYGGQKPLRTSNGYTYQNGYSDHLPLVMRLDFSIKTD